MDIETVVSLFDDWAEIENMKQISLEKESIEEYRKFLGTFDGVQISIVITADNRPDSITNEHKV